LLDIISIAIKYFADCNLTLLLRSFWCHEAHAAISNYGFQACTC